MMRWINCTGRKGSLSIKAILSPGTNTQNLLHVQESSSSVQNMAIYFPWSDYKLTSEPDKPDVPVYMVSSNFFTVLDVEPILGRYFDEREMIGNKQPSAVISYALWQQRFGGREDIVGSSLQLNKRSFTIVGIASANWALPQSSDIAQAVWLPLDMDEALDPRSFGGFGGAIKALVRFNHQADFKAAVNEINSLYLAGAELYTPDAAQDYPLSFSVVPFREALQGDSGKLLSMMMAGAITLILIAMLNLSNLQVARTVSRTQVIAISYAFGASSKQLFKEIFLHNVCLTLLSVLFGLLLSIAGVELIQHSNLSNLPRLESLHIGSNTILLGDTGSCFDCACI